MANSPSDEWIVRVQGYLSQRGNAEFHREIQIPGRILFAVLLSLLLLLAQEPAPLPGVYTPAEGSQDEAILRRFDGLDLEEQQRICQEALAATRALDHPLAGASRALLATGKVERTPREARTAAPLWDAENYAPALKLKSRILSEKASAWKNLAKSCFGAIRPPVTTNRWAWDDGRLRFLLPRDPSPREMLLAMLNGRNDPLGELSAAAEALIDNRSLQASAFYFDHVYRDRKGQVYPGISLGDIWGSQTTFGISDADAIAWMVTVDEDHSLISPIPADQQRPLYRRIEDDYVRLRDVRSLRRALAARYLEPLGDPPAQFGAVCELLDLAWRQQDQDTSKMRRFLQRFPQRATFFAAVRQLATVQQQGGPSEAESKLLADRAAFPMLVRETTLEVLDAEGLLGFHRR